MVERRKQIDILIRISGHGVDYGGEDFDKQSYPQKVFAAIWDLESEVNNGGFPQYFFNSSRETAHFVVEALNTVGAPKTANICERAIAALFPTGLPSDAELIRTVASNFDEQTQRKLNQLSQEFFGYPHDLTDLLFRYVSKHPELFGEFLTTG